MKNTNKNRRNITQEDTGRIKDDAIKRDRYNLITIYQCEDGRRKKKRINRVIKFRMALLGAGDFVFSLVRSFDRNGLI